MLQIIKNKTLFLVSSLAVLFLFALLLNASSIIASEENDPDSSLTYSIGENCIIITGLTDTSVSSITIPSEIEGLPVTEIGYNAFKNCSALEAVAFSESLVKIGTNAFQNCTSLASLVFPGNLTDIGSEAFRGCTGLTSVVIQDAPEAVETIGSAAFLECTSLASVSVPASAIYKQYEAGWHNYQGPFYYDTAIREVTITGTGDMNDSFSNNYAPWFGAGGDITVTIADGVTNIRPNAFNGFTHDIDITIPDSVATIGNNAFTNCIGLSMSTVEAVFASDAAFGNYIFSGCTGLTDELIVPRAITEGMFQNCSGLTSVTFQADLEEIPAYAFRNCSALEEVAFPESLVKIGTNAFQNCTSLVSLAFPGNLTDIGSEAFRGCTGLASVVIQDAPEAVETIGSAAFVECTSLTFVSVPASALYKQYEAGWHNYQGPFYYDTAISEVTITGTGDMNDSYSNAYAPWFGAGGDITVTIADGVTNIRSNAFSGFTHGIDITIPDSVATIGNNAFTNCTGLSMSTVEAVFASDAAFGNNIFSGCTGLTGELVVTRAITEGMFQNCSGLTTVTFQADLEEIPAYAFRNCTSLASLVFPGNLTDIGSEAFRGCTGLISVVIQDAPEAVETIGSAAFLECTSLASVSVPASALYKQYEAGWHNYQGPFYYDTAISEITITGTGDMNDSFSNTYAPWFGAGGDITVTIADGVTNIRSNAFNGFTHGIDITIPDSVATIGNNAFTNCTGLSMSTVEAVFASDAAFGNYIFSGCTGLTDELVVPRAITEGMFQNCSGLTSVTFQADLEEIPAYAFRNCSGLTAVAFPESLVKIGTNAFQSCTSLASLVFPGNLTDIGSEAFRGCTSLTSVVIQDAPETVETIGSAAFVECTSLSSVSIPASALYKQYEAGWHNYQGPFYYDTAISEVTITGTGDMNDSYSNTYAPWFAAGGDITVTIADGVTNIRPGAFSGFTHGIDITVPDSVATIGNNAFLNCPKVKMRVIWNSCGHRYAVDNDYVNVEDLVGDENNYVYMVLPGSLRIDARIENGTLIYKIVGIYDGQQLIPALLILSGYDESGKNLWTQMIPAEKDPDEVAVEQEAYCYRVFLADPDTFEPLCPFWENTP